CVNGGGSLGGFFPLDDEFETNGLGLAPEVSGPSSFEAFFDAEHVKLFGTLCVVTGDVAEAEDLMQEAFVRVWERWERVSRHPDPAGYLYRTAFNIQRNRYRRAV